MICYSIFNNISDFIDCTGILFLLKYNFYIFNLYKSIKFYKNNCKYKPDDF